MGWDPLRSIQVVVVHDRLVGKNKTHHILRGITVDEYTEPITALGVVDDEWPGFNETLTYTNNGPDAYFYLVIDSFGSLTCRDYSFEFIQTGGAVAIQMESLSSVKMLFR